MRFVLKACFATKIHIFALIKNQNRSKKYHNNFKYIDLIETFLIMPKSCTAKTIQNKAEEVLKKPVSIYYAYDLLHRHGWRKVSPRPQHPKSNIEAQEEFKKKFRKQYRIVSQPSIQKILAP